MEIEIMLPRVKSSNTEYRVYRELEDFLYLTDVLVKRGPIIVLQKLTHRIQIPVGEIVNLFKILQEACFSYNPPEDFKKTKFPKGLLQIPKPDGPLVEPDWLKRKIELKDLSVAHTKLFQELTKAQETCLKRRERVQKYDGKVSAVMNEDETNEKKLKQMNKKLLAAQKLLSDDIDLYNKLKREEEKMSRKLQQWSASLEEEMTNRLTVKLTDNLRKLQFVSSLQESNKLDFDMNKLARNIVSHTSKVYNWTTPTDTESAEYDTKIAAPVMSVSQYQQTVKASCCSKNIITFGTGFSQKCQASQTVKTKDKYYIQFKEGAVIKQKLVSMDGNKGFGTTRSFKILPKKWGFYDTALTHPTDIEKESLLTTEQQWDVPSDQ